MNRIKHWYHKFRYWFSKKDDLWEHNLYQHEGKPRKERSDYE